MKAIICTKYGAPDVLQIQEINKPIIKENEVLIKIISTAVNSGDVRMRGLAVGGLMKVIMRLVVGLSKPRNPILGTVYAGIVESVGDKVTSLKKDDKVFGMTGFNFGAYAEYIAIKETDNVSLMPSNATVDEAASIIFSGQTAIYFIDKMNLSQMKGAKILIIGATGSVGSAAVQIAQYYGAEVTAVCGSNGKGFVDDLGVSKIIFYDIEDFTKQNVQYDFIFDAVGKTNKKQCQAILTKGGVYKTVGGLEFASESKDQLELLKGLFESDKLKATIDRIYEFDKIVEAHEYVDTGRKKGNVVVKVSLL